MIKAKKFLYIFLSILILTASNVYAEDGGSVDAEMNYRTNTIEITYTSPLAYPAYITAIMTKSDVTEPVPSDYLRIAQEMCAEHETVELSMKVGDNLDGIYKIFVYASGHDAKNAEAQTMLTILGGSSEDILQELNAAPEDGIAALIYEKTAEALKLENVENPKQLDAYITQIRKKDFGGAFSNLTDVKEAWNSAKVLFALGIMPISEMPEFLTAHQETVQLDLTQEDYLKQTDEVCRIIREQCTKTDGIRCMTELRQSFLENIAVAMINKAPVAQKDTYFKKYASVLGISELMDRYAKLDAAKIARQFDNAAYNNAASVKEKLEAVMRVLENNTPEPGSGGLRPSGGSSGGSGSSAGGSGWPSTEMNTAAQMEPVSENLFSDMNKEHWAFESVKVLKAIHVIDGYEDGSFRPEREVTREEFVKLITVAFEIPLEDAECSFEDVKKEDWFYPYVAAVTAKEIVNGMGNGLFGAGESIQRQDAAVILDRLLIALGADEKESAVEVFGDAEAISDYAAQSVGRLTEANIIQGIDGNFEPTQPVSRAQAAKLIYGCMKYRSEGGLAQ